MPLTVLQLARTIDHALLHPTATLNEISLACQLGAQHQIASVCVRPSDVPLAVSILSGTETKVSTVIGFPHGTTSTAGKKAEVLQAIEEGAQELDMVLNIARLLSGDLAYVAEEIAAICQLAHQQNILLKVIFENCYLSDEQKIAACRICAQNKVDYVKTSTGFGTGGAAIPDICLMRAHSAPETGIKASGGIRDLDTLLAMIACGATRIGTSSTEKLLAAASGRASAGTLREMTRDEACGRQTLEDAKVY